MRRVSVDFRGDRHDVEFRVVEDDPTTGNFRLDWEFADQDMKDVQPTDEENESIESQLAALDFYDPDFYDD